MCIRDRFPDDHQPGVDLILADFEYIEDRLGDIEAIVLTHGHEDHIGALPYLLRLRDDVPLLGSRLTLALVEAKLKEHKITPVTMEVREGDRHQLPHFDLEFLAVNHSIPDALAVAIRTGGGLLPVSYTHLDVYKRQPPGAAAASAPTGAVPGGCG